jgi:hypothetical protein
MQNKSKICAFLCGLTAILGCGSDEGTELDERYGNWYLVDDDGCGTGLTLYENNRFEFRTGCAVDESYAEVEVHEGTFSLVEGDPHVTFNIERSTCADDKGTSEKALMTVEGNHLRLVLNEGVLILNRDKDGVASKAGQIMFGCYDADGYFTPSELH